MQLGSFKIWTKLTNLQLVQPRPKEEKKKEDKIQLKEETSHEQVPRNILPFKTEL